MADVELPTKVVATILVGLIGTALSGCGASVAQSVHAAPRLVAEAPGSPCWPSQGSSAVHAQNVSISAFVGTEATANETSNEAVAALQSGRQSLQMGQIGSAQTSFQTARHLFRKAQLQMGGVAAPNGVPSTRANLQGACGLYVRAIEFFRTGIATENPAYTRRGDAAVSKADQLEGQAWNVLQAGSNAVVQQQADATFRASAGTGSRPRTTRSAVPASVRAAAEHSRAPSPRTATKRVVSALRSPSVTSRSSVRMLPRPQKSSLSYVANVGTMAGWISFGNRSWLPIRYAVPFDGLAGVVSSPGAGASAYLAPYRVKQANYSVEAKIRLNSYDNQAQAPHEGFGIFIRASGTDVNRGFRAGVLNITAPQGLVESQPSNYSYAGFTSGGENLQPYPGYASFQPGINAWHTYRLDVRGEDVTLLIDGMEAARMTTNQFFMDQSVGLFSVNSQIDVATFTVSPL